MRTEECHGLHSLFWDFVFSSSDGLNIKLAIKIRTWSQKQSAKTGPRCPLSQGSDSLVVTLKKNMCVASFKMKIATAAPCTACFFYLFFFFWFGLVMIRFLGPSRQRLWVRCSAQGFCVAELWAPRELLGQKRVIWLSEQFWHHDSGVWDLFVPCFLTVKSFYSFESHPTSKDVALCMLHAVVPDEVML